MYGKPFKKFEMAAQPKKVLSCADKFWKVSLCISQLLWCNLNIHRQEVQMKIGVI